MIRFRRVNYWLALAGVNLLWASQFPAYKIAGEFTDPVSMNFWVLAFACAMLVPFWWRQHRPAGAPTNSARSRISRRDLGRFLILGLCGILPATVFMSWGLERCGASVAAILTLTIPIWMAFLSLPLLGERMNRLHWISLFIALGGMALLTVVPSVVQEGRPTRTADALLLLGACAGSAFYNGYSKKLLARWSELDVLMGGCLTGCLACAVLSLNTARPFYDVAGWPAKVWISVAIIGALTWAIGTVAFLWVLNRLRAVKVAVSIYLMPLFGVLLSAITLNERLTPVQSLAALVVTAASILTTLVGENPKPESLPPGH